MAGYGWNDAVEVEEERDFKPWPEGEYKFTVKDFQRGRTRGGDNQAVYTLHVEDSTGKTRDMAYRIPLIDSCVWKAAQFFRALGHIGAQTTGQVTFPWDRCIGSQGMAELSVREYTVESGEHAGEQRKTNDVVRVFALPGQQQDYGSL